MEKNPGTETQACGDSAVNELFNASVLQMNSLFFVGKKSKNIFNWIFTGALSFVFFVLDIERGRMKERVRKVCVKSA